MSLLEDLFITVVNMSITASFVAIGVIFIRLLLKKAPKIFSYVLWAPVLFRLVCPFSFDSAFSLFSLVNLNAKQGSVVYGFVTPDTGMVRTPAVRAEVVGVDSAVNVSLTEAVPAGFHSAGAKHVQTWLAALSLGWVLGVIVLLVYSIASYVRTKRKLQTATRVDGNVFETDAIGTAIVYGFIRPKIYVPVNIGDTDLSYILEHERTHIRRKDHLVKPLAYLALILHWFNPLMWLSYSLMSRDMEMSCDESVLRRLGDGAKGGYSGSLLSLAVQRKGLLTANPLAFGENHVKTRIKNILNFKKPAFWVIVIAVMAVCAAVIAFASNPPKREAIPEEDRGKLADADSETAYSENDMISAGDEAVSRQENNSPDSTRDTESTDPDQTTAVPFDPTPPEYDPTPYTPSVNEGQYELLVEVKPNVIPVHEIKSGRLYISITNLSEEEYKSRFVAHIEQLDGNDWVGITGAGSSLYPLISLDKGETYELEKRFYVNFTPGKYRLKVDDWYGEFEIVPSDPNMISVEFDPNPITLDDFISSGIVVSIKNLSDEIYEGGSGIDRLERFDGRDWVKVPWVEGRNAVFLYQHNIRPGETRAITRLMADEFDYEFSPGKYRVRYDQWYGEFEII